MDNPRRKLPPADSVNAKKTKKTKAQSLIDDLVVNGAALVGTRSGHSFRNSTGEFTMTVQGLAATALERKEPVKPYVSDIYA
jgi:hypothetical protein